MSDPLNRVPATDPPDLFSILPPVARRKNPQTNTTGEVVRMVDVDRPERCGTGG